MLTPALGVACVPLTRGIQHTGSVDGLPRGFSKALVMGMISELKYCLQKELRELSRTALVCYAERAAGDESEPLR